MKFEVLISGVGGQRKHTVELERSGRGYSISLDGQVIQADAAIVAESTVSVLIAGQGFEVQVTPSPDGHLRLQSGAHEFTAVLEDPRAWPGRRHAAWEAEGRQQIVAPMPGKVVRLLVATGDEVDAGQGLVVVEAMKMQNEIRSPKKGRVERLEVKEGQPVNAGEILCVVS